MAVELRHLRYFVAVARERNFTRAAEKLHIAQPPLSRQVRQLEDELGIDLIEAGSRPLRLSEAGRLFYEQAVQVLERVDEMKAMIGRLHDADRGRFSVGFVGSTLYGKLPEVIRSYRATRPGVELTLLELTSVEQIAALKEGRIDVGFGRIPLDDPGLHRQLLRNEKLVAAVPANHPVLARTKALRLADLAAEPLIVYPKAPRPSYADQVLSLFPEAGVCLVPASVERLRRDNVAYRPMDAVEAVSPIIMSSRKGDRSPELALIVKLIRQLYRKDGIVFGA
jgi:DNA-binding transcriptional LysR family regulator